MLHVTRHMGVGGTLLHVTRLHGRYWGIFAQLPVTWGDGGGVPCYCYPSIVWFFHCYLLQSQVGMGLGVTVTCKM